MSEELKPSPVALPSFLRTIPGFETLSEAKLERSGI
jgi:hypothetical protein